MTNGGGNHGTVVGNSTNKTKTEQTSEEAEKQAAENIKERQVERTTE